MDYTPGPWRVGDTGSCVVTDIEDHPGAWCDELNKYLYGGAMIAGSIRTTDNARLIAAAPQLLEACERAAPWVAKLIAEVIHERCAGPQAAIEALRMLDAAIAAAKCETVQPAEPRK